MSFEKAVEAIIREAQARGEFENLSGEGKPIDLTDYFNTPEELRVAGAMLKNAGMVHAQVELLQEIAALKDLLGKIVNEDQKTKFQKDLREKQLKFSLLMELRGRSGKNNWLYKFSAVCYTPKVGCNISCQMAVISKPV